MILETLVGVIWKKKISSFLAMNIKKYIIPSVKRHNLLKLPHIENGKLYFSPLFQKFELRYCIRLFSNKKKCTAFILFLCSLTSIEM